MKSFLILTAFTSSALASAIQLSNHLMDRDIDPATMNPTLFSVLSVLKTGMPTGPNVPMPTGNSEPDWYQRLPEDVKSLLPSFYPVGPTAQAVVAAATSEVQASQVVSQVVSSVLQSSVAVPSIENTVVSASSSASSSASAASSSLSSTIESLSSTVDALSSTTLTSQNTFTKTSQSASMATNTQSPSSSAQSSESASQTPSSTVLASASATPSSSLSTGARSVAKIEALAIIAFFSVGAGFCIFA
ncbi:hypothetical protein AA0113_g6014 [Alternaria arborescens]|uniref:Uncharacterized protein n=1 Tax=Alternaria arborescens TaxID=156630 RepID=A0A4Q4S129_9PLEO|nr:hypothetical protein AA0111_g5302 [Alternaria arborescens]RYN33959.1 hypothetical protein AA0112_g5493 [Alternaria arborescens]RYO30861.1 hypothetical protein AA0111_g5302 [Alternaria arborescens]RYO63495.1 hypothetical protein AA0113_g6014 [Alternaria arborescens]